MRHSLFSLFATVALATALASGPVLAGPQQPVAVPPSDEAAPLPPQKAVRQSAVIQGRKIDYIVTVGTIDLRDDTGKVTGEVVYTAYTLPGIRAADRPVTFAMNGGPGASSIALNLGALGPKRVDAGRNGDRPSDPSVLRDNPNSWLDVTDLVFIDPVGTGYSRSRLDAAGTHAAFLTPESDIAYLSEVIHRWLAREDRMQSPKYLVGESYGGYRVPRIAYRLQTQLGVGLKGIIMVSPSLTLPLLSENDTITPLKFAFAVPVMAAINLEASGKVPSHDLMAPIEAYARGQYVTDFLAGRADPAATARLVANVSRYSGLSPDTVGKLDGRVDVATFLRERGRGVGKVASFMDGAVVADDPFPASPSSDNDDPILAGDAPRAQAMTDFLARTVGWRVDTRYIASNYDLNARFDRDRSDSAVNELRKVMANDPAMRVMIAHGYNDFACPYLASRVIVDQMPVRNMGERVVLRVYPGGHMFYDRPTSAAAWRGDALALYRP